MVARALLCSMWDSAPGPGEAPLRIRLACFRQFPRPRLDRYGRVVADVDREMARIADGTIEALTALTHRFDGVPIEIVVRFGALRREVEIEREAFSATVVALFDARSRMTRLRLRSLRRRLARRTTARVLSFDQRASSGNDRTANTRYAT